MTLPALKPFILKNPIMPSVIVSQDAQNYRVVEFTASLTIGRDNDNDIVLASPQVSRRHASIVQREDNEFMLFDHESTNGVWLDN
ncbi:MAG: FHA domain-containing protein, partial [Desulfobulbus sp.]|nr:FHA domain-containing protein [Desulfobulbus sp.]